MIKKIFGYLLIGFGSLLFLASVAQLPELIVNILNLFKVLSTKSSSYEMGLATGFILAWLLTLGITALIFIIGIKLTKNKKSKFIK